MLRSDIRRAHMHASISDRQQGSERRQQVRELLFALAEIDHAYEVDLETVRTSDAPIAIKQTVIDTLRQRHQEHRALYVRELHELQKHSRSSEEHLPQRCHWSEGKCAGIVVVK